jgi:hypothetical protein
MVLKKTCLTADGNRAQWRAVDANAATRRSDTRQSKKRGYPPLLAGKPLRNAGQKFASESGNAEKTTLDQLFRCARRMRDDVDRHYRRVMDRDGGCGEIRGARSATAHGEKCSFQDWASDFSDDLGRRDRRTDVGDECRAQFGCPSQAFIAGQSLVTWQNEPSSFCLFLCADGKSFAMARRRKADLNHEDTKDAKNSLCALRVFVVMIPSSWRLGAFA